jgi:two-component system response regulator
MSIHTILLVEDREEDAFLVQYAFGRAEITTPLQVVTDGQMAIDYLSGGGKFSDRAQYPLPGLVLLDLKLPHVMGMDVLAWIRKQPSLKRLIVIILSASINDGDIARAYELNANAFLVKPSGSNTLVDMCKALKHFWLTHNKSPMEFLDV